MAISTVFNGFTLYKPGAYSKTSVELNPGTSTSSTGIVGIVGEADGGAPGSEDGVQSYDITNVSEIAAKYVSGPIVDAVRNLVNPGKDTAIPGGASVIRIYKTNESTLATAEADNQDDASAAVLLDVTSKNYGLTENQISFYVSEGTATDQEVHLISSALTFPLTVTASGTLILTIRGTSYTFTVPSGTPFADLDSILDILNDGANWSSTIPITAYDASSGSDTKVGLVIDTSITAFDAYSERLEYNIAFVSPSSTTGATQLGFRSQISFASDGLAGGTFTVASLGSLEVGKIIGVDDGNSSPLFPLRVTAITGSGPYTIEVDDGITSLTDYTTAQSAVVYDSYSTIDIDTLEVTDGPSGYSRGSRGSRIFNITKNSETETIDENSNDVILRIMYVGSGSAATMTIQDVSSVKTLTTTCTSDSASDLDIDLSDYVTITQLVDYINNFNSGAYVCVSDYFNADSASPSDLDYYNAIDIKTWPLEVKSAMVEIVANVNDQSQFITVEQNSNIYGQLATISSTTKTFLTGAVSGASTNTSFQSGFDKLLNYRCNTVVPLISQDATDDITDGNTDATSTYTIDSVIAMTDSHCRAASNTQNRSERNAYVGFKAAFADCLTQVKLLNSEYTSFAIQDIQVRDSTDTAYWADPWMFAVIAAGMQSGSEIGTPITYKYMNALGIDHDDFDAKTDYNTALKNGILFAEQPDAGGVRIVLGNTSYLSDDNPVFSLISQFELANYMAYNSRQQIEPAFIGKTRAASDDSIIEAVTAFIVSILSTYRRDGLLAPDEANAGLGYRNLTVTISGGTISYQVILTIAPEIDFILGDYILSQVQDSVTL